MTTNRWETGEILDRVRAIAAELADVSVESIEPSSELDRDLGMDSLTRTELAMAVEEAFGLELADEDAERITTIQHAVEAILAAGPPAALRR